jgi:hypothetical protein
MRAVMSASSARIGLGNAAPAEKAPAKPMIRAALRMISTSHKSYQTSRLAIYTSTMHAADPNFCSQIATWREVPVPSDSDPGNRAVWFYAANYSRHEWEVFNDAGEPSARLKKAGHESRSIRPVFVPAAGEFKGASAFSAVDDGWLVGFNQGEFGAALFWFSLDGERSYQISDHQIVDFVALSDGVYAVEGLAHLGISRGSVIRVSRPNPAAHWQASTIVALPFAPYAVSVAPGDSLLMTLSESLVLFGRDHKMHDLCANAPWSGLYPNSSVLSQDAHNLYIGMRQFVAEFDLTTQRLRLLVPSAEFLNRLAEGDARQIREQYGD